MLYDIIGFDMGALGKVEENFMVDALAEGFEVIRNGWPDFILVKGSEVVFIEVKAEKRAGGHGEQHLLHVDQLRLLRVLEALGLKVRISQGDIKTLYTVSEYLELTRRIKKDWVGRKQSPILGG